MIVITDPLVGSRQQVITQYVGQNLTTEVRMLLPSRHLFPQRWHVFSSVVPEPLKHRERLDH